MATQPDDDKKDVTTTAVPQKGNLEFDQDRYEAVCKELGCLADNPDTKRLSGADDNIKLRKMQGLIYKELITTEIVYNNSLKNIDRSHLAQYEKACGKKGKEFFKLMKLYTEIGQRQQNVLATFYQSNIEKWAEEIQNLKQLYMEYTYLYEKNIMHKETAFKGKEREKVEKIFKQIHPNLAINLESHLIMPIQRLPRYKLLLADLKKHTEKTHPNFSRLEDATFAVEQLAMSINNELKQREEKEKELQAAALAAKTQVKAETKAKRDSVSESPQPAGPSDPQQRVKSLRFSLSQNPLIEEIEALKNKVEEIVTKAKELDPNVPKAVRELPEKVDSIRNQARDSLRSFATRAEKEASLERLSEGKKSIQDLLIEQKEKVKSKTTKAIETMWRGAKAGGEFTQELFSDKTFNDIKQVLTTQKKNFINQVKTSYPQQKQNLVDLIDDALGILNKIGNYLPKMGPKDKVDDKKKLK